MQNTQRKAKTRDQRLLRLKFAVQRERLHKVRDYLEALEEDLRELENAILWGPRKSPQRSDKEENVLATTAFLCPREDLPSDGSADQDGPCQSLICGQLPQQLALLSTLEPTPTCFCGLPCSRSTTLNTNQSVSLVISSNSPRIGQDAGYTCDKDQDVNSGTPCGGSQSGIRLDDQEHDHKTLLSSPEIDERAGVGVQHNDDLPKPELYGTRELIQSPADEVDSGRSDAQDNIGPTAYIRRKQDLGRGHTVDKAHMCTEAELGDHSRNCSASSYTSKDSDSDSLKMMQQQEQQQDQVFAVDLAPTSATRRAYSHGASDVFTQAHIRHQADTNEALLLHSHHSFAARMARQSHLNQRLCMQGVLTGSPWTLQEHERLRLWNQLQRKSPPYINSTMRGLSWARGGVGGCYDSSERRGRGRVARSRACGKDEHNELVEPEREDSFGRAVAGIEDKKDMQDHRSACLQPDIAGEISDAEQTMIQGVSSGRSC